MDQKTGLKTLLRGLCWHAVFSETVCQHYKKNSILQNNKPANKSHEYSLLWRITSPFNPLLTFSSVLNR